jgi:flagella basal body P-ring formation protein FlgA
MSFNQMQRLLLVMGCVLWLAAASDAGEIVLRSKAFARGPLVRLSDIADVKGSEGESTERLAATPLMPGPAAGTTRFLRRAELRDLLAARGVNLSSWRITGAEAVELGVAKVAANGDASTPGDSSAASSPGDQLNELVNNYLRQQTGHDLWSVIADADDDVVAAMQAGGDAVALSGGKAPWTGRQRFFLSNGDAKLVVVYARVERLELAAIAVRTIERGELVRRSDIAIRPYAGSLPAQAFKSVDAAIGKEAVQMIREGSLVLSNFVRSPIIVHRGERVSVRARAAGIVVRTFAIAQQDGGVGELVVVQAIDGKDRYAARVSGVRELEVFAAEARATEVAAAPQSGRTK